jgi:hypothetical protein
MADLGGDYYDYFSIDDSRFAVLLGDVAGHGVGPSLIMAMAKPPFCAAKNFMISTADNQQSHHLICTTRSKRQRKIMTFQYLCFDKTMALGIRNAGDAHPCLSARCCFGQ